MEIRNGRGSPVGSGQETQELRFKFTEFAVAKGAVFSRNLVKRRKGRDPGRRGGVLSFPLGHARQEVVPETEYSRWGPPWTLRLKERTRFITPG